MDEAATCLKKMDTKAAQSIPNEKKNVIRPQALKWWKDGIEENVRGWILKSESKECNISNPVSCAGVRQSGVSR